MVDEKKSNYILIFFPAHTLLNLKREADEPIKNFMLWGGGSKAMDTRWGSEVNKME